MTKHSNSPAAKTTTGDQAKAAPAQPTVGRIVLYSLAFKDHTGAEKIETRAALVARVWPRNDGLMPLIQLAVFRDGTNDGGSEKWPLAPMPEAIDAALAKHLGSLAEAIAFVASVSQLVVWKTSVAFDEAGAPGTWRWMPYQIGQAKKTEEASGSLASQFAELSAKVEKLLAAQTLGNTEPEAPHVPADAAPAAEASAPEA